MIDASDSPDRVAQDVGGPPERPWHPPEFQEVDYSETGFGGGAVTQADDATYGS